MIFGVCTFGEGAQLDPLMRAGRGAERRVYAMGREGVRRKRARGGSAGKGELGVLSRKFEEESSSFGLR